MFNFLNRTCCKVCEQPTVTYTSSWVALRCLFRSVVLLPPNLNPHGLSPYEALCFIFFDIIFKICPQVLSFLTTTNTPRWRCGDRHHGQLCLEKMVACACASVCMCVGDGRDKQGEEIMKWDHDFLIFLHTHFWRNIFMHLVNPLTFSFSLVYSTITHTRLVIS